MRCPTLAELSPPPAGKTGWPWTVETPQLPPARPDGSPWPRISIVTPSYNQGQFIEETIRSVLLQGYPDLEYIIIDGASTDQSVDIIKKYQPWLTHWVSEKDRGQAHAINKGFARASGQIGAYLNSDDWYTLDTFSFVGHSFSSIHWDLLIGNPIPATVPSWRYLRRSWWKQRLNYPPRPFFVADSRYPYAISQESTFWNLLSRGHLQFDENLHCCLDVDWYCKIAPGAKIALTGRQIGFYRHHPLNKSSTMLETIRSEISHISAHNKSFILPYEEYENIHKGLGRQSIGILSKSIRSRIEECVIYCHPELKYIHRD
ncbi:MAG TPA: glycosyltransferase family 2 protein [Stellaceae bacterium]|jgi:glycosyltransferase involved in cell wall biosynthesis|nr:glycosyltransferase family 2 protein [Stellaceae bacterium]